MGRAAVAWATKVELRMGFLISHGFARVTTRHGTNLNLPEWQRRGIGLQWETYGHPGRSTLVGHIAGN